MNTLAKNLHLGSFRDAGRVSVCLGLNSSKSLNDCIGCELIGRSRCRWMGWDGCSSLDNWGSKDTAWSRETLLLLARIHFVGSTLLPNLSAHLGIT